MRVQDSESELEAALVGELGATRCHFESERLREQLEPSTHHWKAKVTPSQQSRGRTESPTFADLSSRGLGSQPRAR